MPDVGVLNLTIKDNSEQAGQGLNALARALAAVKEAQQRFNLSKVGEQVTQLAKTIQEAKGTSTIIKNLGTMFNAINNFSKIKGFNLNAQEIRDYAQSMNYVADALERTDRIKTQSTGDKHFWEGMTGQSAKQAVNEMKTTVDSYETQMDRALEVASRGGGIASLARMSFAGTAPGSSNLLSTTEQITQAGEAYRDYAEATEQAMERERREQDALTESTEHYFQAFDKVTGTYQYYNEQTAYTAKESADVMQNMDEASNAIINFVNLRNTPPSGNNSIFSNASEEIKYLFEQVERSQASLQQWADIYERAATQIKYGGPRDKDELAFDLKHAEEGFYAEYEALERSYTALDNALDAANAYAAGSRDVAAAAEEETARLVALADAAERVSLEMARANVSNVSNVESAATSSVVEAQANANRMAIQMLFDTLEHPPQVQFSDVVDNINGVGRGAMSARESMSAFLEAMQGGDAYTAYIRELNPEMAELSDNIERAGGHFRDLDNIQEECAASTFSIRDALDRLRSGITAMFPTLTQLVKRFTSMAKMRMLRYAIREIAKGFKEGVQNVYEYSKAIGSSFAPSMDSAASALAQMKNSIGAAAAPVIQALIPVLQNVVSWFINLLNYANQFFALLNGQKTWTRALPQTTEAFKKQEKAAKKTGAAIKDLLADWDELNIIQSNTSGAGTGAGTSAAEDYLSMFEEVSSFDSKIKDIVGFIKENFDTIKTVAEGIGAAILLWRLSEGFGHALGMLQKLELAAGLILVIDGVKVTAEAGRNLGKDFATGTVDWDNIEKAVRGVLETAFGTGLVSLALGAGVVPGFVLGLAGGLTILGFEMREGYYDTLYGDVHEDVDEIRIALEEGLLDIDAQATIDVTKAAIKDIDDAEGQVRTALKDLEKNYPVGVEITPDNAADFKDKVQALVTATNTLIHDSDTFLGLTVPATPEFSGSFVDDAWGNVEGYVNELGKQIGEALDKGINDNVKLEELEQKLLHISEAIVNAQKSSETSARVGVLGSAVRQNNEFGQYDRETIANYVKEYNDYLSEKMGEATGFAEQRYVELNRLIAGLETSIDEGEGIYPEEKIEEMKHQLETARKELVESFGENGEYIKRYAKENYFDPWTQAGRQMFGNDIAGALQNAMNLYNNKKYMYGIAMRDVAPAARNVKADDKWVDYYLRKQQEALLTAISEGTGMKMDEVKELLENAGIDPLSMFDEDFVEQYRNKIISWLSTTDLSKDQKSRILSSVGLNIDDLVEDVKNNNKPYDLLSPAKFLYNGWVQNGRNTIDYWKGIIQNQQEEKTKEGFTFNDDNIDDLYKHLYLSLAGEGYEGANGAKYLNEIDELMESGSIEIMKELLKQINEHGIPEAFDMLKNYQNGFGWTLGANGQDNNFGSIINPNNYIASMGGPLGKRPDVGYPENNPYYVYPTNSGSSFGSEGLEMEASVENEHFAEDIEKGSKAANKEMEELLRNVVTGLTRLMNKNWTVNVTPTAAWGQHNAKSNDKYTYVTGVEMV